ncbi:lipoprotein insertase outer membrane protein LolB [Tahibacter amnicola]|uniref:Outer-membrane lipoprotein LolB n=1 Tax=Tahibacter amnicola TaxID=2976241 RepID=A0ABY6BBI1_9GAMM|nr:lipoprotein insertase outer membrane protein LolB [Tahibacter amnicola]UXI67416.1 lipoprotein insertase outer membrane protein LolB [Tahibacter amnicola]
MTADSVRRQGAGRGVLLFRAALAAATLLLAACAPMRTREDAATLRIQQQREAALAQAQRWQLSGRLAVSNGEDGGNGDLEWRQDGERFDLTLRAPVTGKNWRLHGDASRATLEGARDQVLTDRSAAALLDREMGWHVPVQELEYWVRALRAPGSRAQLVFNEHQLPATLTQSGWTIEYKDYFGEQAVPLPRKVFATRGKYRVRLFIEEWQAP